MAAHTEAEIAHVSNACAHRLAGASRAKHDEQWEENKMAVVRTPGMSASGWLAVQDKPTCTGNSWQCGRRQQACTRGHPCAAACGAHLSNAQLSYIRVCKYLTNDIMLRLA